MNAAIVDYINSEIIPRYDSFDEAHQREHAQMVIDRALSLCKYYPVNKEMVYVSAAYHDLGLAQGREHHHLVSGEILRNDQVLRAWFSEEEIELMAQAAEDHRASAKHSPRSIYGKIIAEADRLIDVKTVVLRTLLYGRKHYPELSLELQCERAIQHLHEKYGPQGYLKLWIPESPNALAMRDLHALIADELRLRMYVFDLLQSLE